MDLMILILLCSILFQCGHSSNPVQTWFDSSWAYRQEITIDNALNSTHLQYYEVKVTLNKSNFDFSKAQRGGRDLRFTDKSAMHPIYYWIESWNDTAGMAEVWVKVPDIPAHDSTRIYMYFGNPRASDNSDGEGTFEFYDDFEKSYSGSTGWTTKSPMPVRSADPAAVVYGNKIYVIGGYDHDTTANCAFINLQAVQEYDPSSNTWVRKADMPTGRWGPTAVALGGLIHVFAGKIGLSGTSTHEIYNPANDTWSIGTPVPIGLADQGGVAIEYNGVAHMFYGNSHYEYDPVTDIYTPRAAIPTMRKWATCALVDNKIYLIGGASGTAYMGVTNVNEVYDIASDSWSTKAPLPEPRFGMGEKNPVINGKIYVAFGQTPYKIFLTDNLRYDPVADKWERMSSGVYPRDGVGCGVVNNKLYILGGRDLIACPPGRDFVEEYDPLQDNGGGSNPWFYSDTTVIRRDPIAAYKGNYGLLMDQNNANGIQFAIHYHELRNLAVDFYWNVTDFYGLGAEQPQGLFSLTHYPSFGSLYYYDNNGLPDMRWYNGSFLSIHTGEWNKWHRISLVWSGADSKVIIDTSNFSVQASDVLSTMIFLRVNKMTRQYFDVFRVRRYSSPEPSATVGAIEAAAK